MEPNYRHHQHLLMWMKVSQILRIQFYELDEWKKHKMNKSTYLQKRWAQHGHKESLIEKVEKLVANHLMSHLNNSIAKF